MNLTSSTLYKIRAIALSLALCISALYSMDDDSPVSDGLEEALANLSLNETQLQQPTGTTPTQPAQTPPLRRSPIRSPLRSLTQEEIIRRSPTQVIRPIGNDAPSPIQTPQRIMPIQQPGPATPNQLFTDAAAAALEDLESGEINAEQALERIRQFLPVRLNGNHAENRNPNPLNQ